MSAITLKGLKETVDAMAELDRKMQKSIVRKGMRVGAKVMLAAARAEAPERTGMLRRNVKIRNGRSGDGVFALSVGVNKKDFKGPAFYGAFVLFGHKVGNRDLGDGRTQVPENDFLLRAYDQVGEQSAEVASDAIADLTEQEANT